MYNLCITFSVDLPKEIFEIANKFIHVSFSGRFVYNVLVVVVTETTTQFFVVHLRLVLAHAPSAGHFVRIGKFEFPVIARPRYKRLASAVSQQLQQELPQLYRSTAGETRTAVCTTTRENPLIRLILQFVILLQMPRYIMHKTIYRRSENKT